MGLKLSNFNGILFILQLDWVCRGIC